ncbi:Dual specificity tyrosine-phosphorylation-regulated kinase 2, partial [Gryllus bimaculatus]
MLHVDLGQPVDVWSVMLHVDLGPPVDVWSLGCVAAELAMGRPLFEGANEAEMIFCICSMLGAPPQAMMLRSSRSTLYFWIETRGTLCVWHLLDADALGIGKNTATRRIRYLSEVMEVHFAQRKRFGRELPNKEDSLDFLDILTKMLTLCP